MLFASNNIILMPFSCMDVKAIDVQAARRGWCESKFQQRKFLGDHGSSTNDEPSSGKMVLEADSIAYFHLEIKTTHGDLDFFPKVESPMTFLPLL